MGPENIYHVKKKRQWEYGIRSTSLPSVDFSPSEVTVLLGQGFTVNPEAVEVQLRITFITD